MTSVSSDERNSGNDHLGDPPSSHAPRSFTARPSRRSADVASAVMSRYSQQNAAECVQLARSALRMRSLVRGDIRTFWSTIEDYMTNEMRSALYLVDTKEESDGVVYPHMRRALNIKVKASSMPYRTPVVPNTTINGPYHIGNDVDFISDCHLCVDGRIIHIDNYLRAFTEMSARLLRLQTSDTITGLRTTLETHQVIGIQKGYTMCFEGPWHGFILGDAMGLGKTLQTYGIIQKARQNGKIKGLTLVVTKEAAIPEWVRQANTHFEEGRKPRVLLLSDKSITATDIARGGYDTLMITYETLVARHLAFLKKKAYFDLVQSHGYGKANNMLDAADWSKVDRRDNDILFTSVASEQYVDVGFLVLDEAQRAKNITGEAYRAIKALDYRKCIVATASFFPNTWNEIYALLTLIPGQPFHQAGQFMRLFASVVSNANGTADHRGPPAGLGERRLIQLLQGCVLARPIDVLRLPGLDGPHYLTFDIPDAMLSNSLSFFERFRKTLAVKMRTHNANVDAMVGGDFGGEALGFATRAIQAATHPMLIPDPEMTAADTRTRAITKRGITLTQRVRRHQARLDSMAETFGISNTLSQTSLIALTGLAIPGGTSEQDPDDSGFDEDDPTPRTAEQDRGSRRVRRQAWIDRIRNIPHENTMTPKIRAAVEQLVRDHETAAGEKPKTVIMSQYLEVLDLVNKAIKEEPRCIQYGLNRPYEYNGTISTQQRERVRQEFNTSSSHHPILVTAEAGGVGLDLTGASTVIMMEPWWNWNSTKQGIGRLLRLGQGKTVKVYIMKPNFSVMDDLIIMVSTRKRVQNNELEKYLVLEDGQPAPSIV